MSEDDKTEVSSSDIYVSSLYLTCGTSQLKRAKKEGRLAEALLDRRAKLKR